jgi:hypothetical protein
MPRRRDQLGERSTSMASHSGRRGLLAGAAVPPLLSSTTRAQGPTTATRKRMLDQVAADRVRVTGYDFPFPAHGFIARDGAERYRFVPSNWLS